MSVQAELNRISAGIPEELKSGLVREVVDDSEEQAVKEHLAHGRVREDMVAQTKRMVARGAFRSTESVTDEKKVAELDKYHTAKIQAAIRDGKLPDPAKDPFMQKRLAMMKRR